jgi:hypothetical protein
VRCRGVTLSKTRARKAAAARLQVRQHRPGECVSDFTHLVADELVLSVHALIALAAGRPIVASTWLERSIDVGTALPVGDLLLHDSAAERKHRFSLPCSLAAAKAARLLHGAHPSPLRACSACITESARPICACPGTTSSQGA